MDPETVPAYERSFAAESFDCPYCGSEAGFRCSTDSGESYNEWSYVHADRLIAMYRDAYLHQGDVWKRGWEVGITLGWKQGVLDARYTFENTPVVRGCRAKDSLKAVGQGAGADSAGDHEPDGATTGEGTSEAE